VISESLRAARLVFVAGPCHRFSIHSRNGFGNLWVMSENFRHFQAGPDPFGRTWDVELRWCQNGISIRHANTIDVKFVMSTKGQQGAGFEGLDSEAKQEKIVALPHPALLALASKTGHALTDSWCMRLAARHLRQMISSGEDFEKTVITVFPPDLERAAGVLQSV
jgi:hypothetical protein